MKQAELLDEIRTAVAQVPTAMSITLSTADWEKARSGMKDPLPPDRQERLGAVGMFEGIPVHVDDKLQPGDFKVAPSTGGPIAPPRI